MHIYKQISMETDQPSLQALDGGYDAMCMLQNQNLHVGHGMLMWFTLHGRMFFILCAVKSCAGMTVLCLNPAKSGTLYYFTVNFIIKRFSPT